MKTLIIGGVAAGTKAAAKLKRLDRKEDVEIVTESDSISYAGCGLTAQPARYAFICSLAASAKVLMPAAGQCAQRSSRSGREPAWR